MKKKLSFAIISCLFVQNAMANTDLSKSRMETMSQTDTTSLQRKKLSPEQCSNYINAYLPKGIKDICQKKCSAGSVVAEYNFTTCGREKTEQNPSVSLRLMLAYSSLAKVPGGTLDFAVSVDCQTGKLEAESVMPVRYNTDGTKKFIDVKTVMSGPRYIKAKYDDKKNLLTFDVMGVSAAAISSSSISQAEEALKSLSYHPLSLSLNYLFDKSILSNSSFEKFPLNPESSVVLTFPAGTSKALQLEADDAVNGVITSKNLINQTLESDFPLMFGPDARRFNLGDLANEDYEIVKEQTAQINWNELTAFARGLAELSETTKVSRQAVDHEFNRFGKFDSNAMCMSISTQVSN